MRPFEFSFSLLLLLVGFLMVNVGVAAACGNGKLISEDKFQTLDDSWTLASDSDKPTAGAEGLTATIPPNHDIAAMKAGKHQDVEVCAVFTSNSPKDSTDFFAIRFWFDDSGGSYWAVAFPERGLYVVERLSPDHKVSVITPKTNNSSLLNDSGANEVSVRLRGNSGWFLVNGKTVSNFSGQPPEGGGRVGFIMIASGKNTEPTDFNLKSFQIRELGEEPEVIARAPTEIQFCNEFAHTIHFAIAYEANDVWTSEGWLTVAPDKCGALTAHPELTSFYYRGESDVFDEKQVSWGTDRDFALKKDDFTIPKAEARAPGSKMAKFSGPITRDSPARTLSLSFAPDMKTMVVKGPNPQ